MAKLLKVKNLSAGYKKEKRILNDISFSLDEGRLLGIIGPNGAGKSTLFCSLLRLIPFMSGTVTINGANIKETSSKSLAREIGFLPQILKVRKGINVYQTILLGRYPYINSLFYSQEDKKKVLDVLDKLEISHFKDRDITELSGGEFKKVMIARLLVQEVKILLLDEPFAHLDPKHTIEILEILLKLKKHKAIICAFHDLRIARHCDELILLKNGRIVSQGEKSKILNYNNLTTLFEVKDENKFNELIKF